MNVERKHREIIGNKEEIFFSLASLSSTDGASRHVPLGICSSWLSLSATCRGAPGYCRLGVLSSGSDRFFSLSFSVSLLWLWELLEFHLLWFS